MVTLAQKIFFDFADRNKNLFESLRRDLITSNTNILIQNYVSMMIFYTLLSLLFSVFITGIVFFITKEVLSLAILILPIITFVLFYIYPSMKRNSLKERIKEEIPFATIYMSAISSSELPLLKMLKLVANSREYPYISYEVKKILSQVELYGYDLSSALREVSKNCPSEKLGELFSGLATNISGGSSLKNYLEKKAENYLVDYKLDRERYNKLAETLLDIYVSILIAAPLIFTVLLSVMAYSGIKIGFSVNLLFYLIISVTCLLNIFFLIFIEIKRPRD
ncbi:MAG: type II secretion system F family protein [Candidatus Pacearchaeota archaeon]